LATSPRNPNFFVDDPGKLYKQRRCATQAKGLETLDPKAKVEGPSESPRESLSYGPPWAHYLGGYQDRLLVGPLGLPGLRYTAPEGMEHKDYTGVVLG
jgi:hypothetical protein